ncbi:hypothetical protein [Plebeiibacterium sediminum]|uniref:Beta-galactosidase trimerisation domain-containing protein n=1 Tax=Plebeiibacterium sediminum TaxID=2992112 RepID=A0AAE3M211_9BACT|nr:hypothetical protein [Plebeiobacterium sediminum]MCW3785290.1 hypothetical protein [Plebeiobacterium sediminum]
MKYRLTLYFLGIVFSVVAQTNKPIKTTFQTAHEWRPTIDVRADAAMIYGVNGNPTDTANYVSFENRVKSWADKGYETHFMTGIAWGEYQDYFTGKWDGKTHFDEGQVQQNGDTIWHGPMVPYIVPTPNFLKYIKEAHIKRVLDAGISTIFLEEPEFWAFGGYSEAFKKEWANFYGFNWKPQHESPENTYLSNKLKYHLYYNALNEVFTYAKEYGKSIGLDVKCYVPTHSLINYTQWQIVSPEASLASLSCVDGYIAQVWTGTSRTPNYYNGNRKERVFETAFLEYGSMESMTAPSGRKIYFLTDPIEDRARDWSDYIKNYEATFAAQLLYPGINNYEVMPWPTRIYEGSFKTSADSDKLEKIPGSFATQMQVMINALNHIPKTEQKLSGSQGIGVLMSNSMMFQRFPTFKSYDDPQLSSFFGQTLPLLKRGIPVKTVHIENVSFPETWKDLQILVMSYSNMKPMEAKAHDHIAQWVKDGGVLVYCGSDNDPYQQIPEWWNTEGNNFKAPSEDLFSKLGIKDPYNAGIYQYGQGKVCIIKQDPKHFVLKQDQDTEYLNTIKELYFSKTNKELAFKNNFSLRRGPYEIISVLDENNSETPYAVKGKVIDLFNPEIPILDHKEVLPGEQSFLYHIDNSIENLKPQVLVSASRIYNETLEKKKYSFVARSPINTTNVMRISLPEKIKRIQVKDAKGLPVEYFAKWDKNSKTLFLTFENNPEGVSVSLKW